MPSRLWLALIAVLLTAGSPIHARELPKDIAWLWEFESAISVRPARSGDTVLVVVGDRAMALKASDGTRLWESKLAYEWRSDQPSIIHQGAWILPASGGTVVSLDIATGKQRWSADCARRSPALCAGRLILMDRESLRAVDPASGEVRWRLPGSGFRGMAVQGSRILYTTGDEIGVWDLASGKSLWKERSEETDEPRLSGLVALSAGTDLVARDPLTGKKLWKLPNCDVFELNGDLVLARADYKLQARAARTGLPLWSNDQYASKFAEAGPNLVAVSDNYGFALLDRRTGKPVANCNGYFPPLLDGGTLWAGGTNGHLYRWDARSGKPLPGSLTVFGFSSFSTDGPGGAAGKGWGLLPAGSALLALGKGPGLAHMASKPQLELSVDTPQTPGKILLSSEASFVRSQTLKVYRCDAQGAPSGAPLISKALPGEAGYQAHWQSFSVVLKEPGNYVLELSSAGVTERKTLTVTPIGLAVKLAPGQMLVQTLDIVRRVPLPGVHIQAGPEKGNPVMSGTTGPDGLLSMSTDTPLDQRLRLDVRRNKESFPFVISPERFASTEKIFLQTDRPLYRSGHEVNFQGLAASGELPQPRPLVGIPVKVEVRDCQDNPLLSQELVTDSFGAFSGSLRLPAEPPLGTYRVSAQMGEGESFSLPFEVQEYRKPPFEVALTTDTPLVLAGQSLQFHLAASYYFGGPVPGATARVTVRRAELSGPPSPGNPGYQSYADFVSEQTVVLDAEGRTTVTVPTLANAADSEYLVNVEVTGPSGQVVEGSASALAQLEPYGVYLGSSSWIAYAGTPTSITVRTLDRLARPHTASVKLRVEQWKKAGWAPIAHTTVTTGANGQGIFQWTPPKQGGDFRIVAIATDSTGKGRPLDEVTFWVSGSESESLASSERKLTPERQTYKPGETARLIFQARHPGPAMLTVEGQKLFQSRVFEARPGAQILSFPVEAAHSPGVTVTVTSLEKPGALVVDQATLQVPDSQHQLSLSLKSDRTEYRPGETALLELTVTDAQGQPVDAQASLAVVDEALFALRPDQVPSLHSTFFGPHSNRVQTFLMQPRRSEVAGFQTVPSPTRVRKDFKDTAYWQPHVLVPAGKARISVPLPDNLTRWRATTRASTREMEVGQGTTTLVSNLPLMVQAILPRFLVEGDGVDMMALVSNRTKAPVDVEVKLSANPGVLERREERIPDLPADGQGRAVSRLQVEENVLGKAPLPSRLQVQVEARSDASPPESDAEQIEIPIRPFGSPYAKGGAGLVKAGENKVARVESPRALLKPNLEIRVAGSPLAAVEGALDYLADFPYGCVEQTMSRFLPTVIAAQAMGDLGVFSEERKAKLAPMVEKGLSALYGYQHSDGGWGWWEYDKTNPYLTGYVISGLAMARRAGYTVSEPVLRHGIGSAKYQLEVLSRPRPLEAKTDPEESLAVENLDIRIYLAWALAEAGEPPIESLQSLSAEPEKLSTYSVALLALAWQRAEQSGRAAPLVAELERRVRPAGIGATWPAQALGAYGWTDDDIEATALAARAVMAEHPESDTAREAMLWLLSQREGAKWKSTRDTAQAVLALLDFAGNRKHDSRTGSLDVRWDGRSLQVVPLQDKEVVVKVPAEQLTAGGHSLELKSSGSQAIYSYAETGFLREREQVDLPGESQGLRIVRTYVVDQPGQLLRINRVTPPEILNVASGQEVEVEIEFELPARMQYLKLEDPRPAGFEVIEGSLAGERPAREEHRDALSAFFFTDLGPGKHSFTYRMRAETPGDYRSLPARVELMYRPAVYGATPSQRVKVRRRGEEASR